MKASMLLLAGGLLVSSCATPAPVSETDAAPSSAKSGMLVAASKSKPRPPARPKAYPLETCLVTGDDLDDMDERVSTVYQGQTFEFCCKPCVVKFRKNPSKYVAKLAKLSAGG